MSKIGAMDKAALARSIIKDKGTVRLTDFLSAGVSTSTLRRLVSKGEITQITRGVYGDPDQLDAAPGLHRDISEAFIRCGGKGVICLITAGQFHGLTDENSPITIALPRNADTPAGEGTEHLTFVRWTDPRMFTIGVETARMCGAEIRITSSARTVADMLRRRNRMFRPDGTAMLGQYLRDGHDLAEIRRVASELGIYKDLEAEIGAAQEVVKWGSAPGRP